MDGTGADAPGSRVFARGLRRTATLLATCYIGMSVAGRLADAVVDVAEERLKNRPLEFAAYFKMKFGAVLVWMLPMAAWGVFIATFLVAQAGRVRTIAVRAAV